MDTTLEPNNYNPIEAWLDNVALSHSNSNGTREVYKQQFQIFCNFIKKTPQQILTEYSNSTDRQFRHQYAQYVRAFISAEFKKNLAPNSLLTRLTAIKSFFKYNDLPLGHVPIAKARVIHHNRDITKEEIKLILESSKPRERAFYAIMSQSGLRPTTISNLRYKHIKEDFLNNRIPCKIEVPEEIAKGKYHSYFTFIGEEAAKYLRAYLYTRPNIKDDDYIFFKEGTKEKTDPKSFAGLFRKTVTKLSEKGLMEVTQKEKGKPRDIRLYNLRKFFRKYANQAGFEFVQFWMGYTVRAGVDEHYRPRDEEFHRQLYKEKAMPFLRIETFTPTETDKTIKALAQRNKELETMVASLSVENKGYGEQIANLQKNFNLILKEINKLKGIQEDNP